MIITAPTGSGKTLAGFLAILSELFKLGEEGKLEQSIYCIYISPLKALDNDVQKNLLVPLKEIREIASSMGKELPEVRAALRTGDVPASEKARQGVLDAVKIGKIWYSSKRAIGQYISEHCKQDTKMIK